MQKAARKMGAADGGIRRFLGTAQRGFRAAVTRSINEKNFENLPRVFLRKKPGANHQKPNPTKENRKDAHEAIDHE
jgi:hypothetical protein